MISTAVAIDTFERNERVLHEGRRQIVLDYAGKRLEDLEVMSTGGGPEYQVGFDRRAAGDAASHLRHHDRVVVGERKARTGPVAHSVGRGAVSRALLAEAEHCNLYRHARPCPGHPRLTILASKAKTWMAGTSP